MKPIEINRAIAEWCGWRDVGATFGRLTGTRPDGMSDCQVPNYFRDLNSCHEAESRLTEAQKAEYVDMLHALYRREFDVIHSTAPQRCEALLRTLKLWRDE